MMKITAMDTIILPSNRSEPNNQCVFYPICTVCFTKYVLCVLPNMYCVNFELCPARLDRSQHSAVVVNVELVKRWGEGAGGRIKRERR